MSVVDQRAWLVTGVVRRLLLRAVLVLGGACAVTVVGWLFCAGSASADVLPSVPSVPSVLSSVTSNVTAVAPKKVEALSIPDLSAVGRQAHDAVTDVSGRVAPSVIPAAELVPHTDLVPLTAQIAPADKQQVTNPAAARKTATDTRAQTLHRVSQVPSRPRQPFVAVAQQRGLVARTAAPLSRSVYSTPSPLGVGDHHSPTLPPLQPAGSSDSSVHGGSGTPGGSGGAQFTFTHLVGDGLTMADTSSTPRIAAGPGRQPGTSPD